jgi:hypothetical protein
MPNNHCMHVFDYWINQLELLSQIHANDRIWAQAKNHMHEAAGECGYMDYLEEEVCAHCG